jgi:hypothetical protein
MDPVPGPLFLRKSGSSGNQTRDFWICSQELWPLDHRGGDKYALYIHIADKKAIECLLQPKQRICVMFILLQDIRKQSVIKRTVREGKVSNDTWSGRFLNNEVIFGVNFRAQRMWSLLFFWYVHALKCKILHAMTGLCYWNKDSGYINLYIDGLHARPQGLDSCEWQEFFLHSRMSRPPWGQSSLLSFCCGKAAGTWSWPLTSMKYWAEGWWCDTFTPMYVFMVWYLINHRVILTFTLQCEAA